MQKFGQLLIKYGLAFYKNGLVQIYTKYLVVPSQKDPAFDTQKMINDFFVQRK